MSEQDSTALRLAEARAGSRESLGQAFEAYRCYLLLIAEQELGADLRAKGGASDLVQETFLQVQRDFGRFEGRSSGEWRAWLRRVLLNRLANFRRLYKQQKRGLDQEIALEGGDSSLDRRGGLPANDPTPSVQAVAGEQAIALERAMQALPEEYRQVIAMRYQQQLTFEQIGLVLSKTANATRKLWWRAIERLQEEMEKSL